MFTRFTDVLPCWPAVRANVAADGSLHWLPADVGAAAGPLCWPAAADDGEGFVLTA